MLYKPEIFVLISTLYAEIACGRLLSYCWVTQGCCRSNVENRMGSTWVCRAWKTSLCII